jgi:hypothetical protein
MGIRTHLTFDNDLNVIISIGNRDDNQAAFSIGSSISSGRAKA